VFGAKRIERAIDEQEGTTGNVKLEDVIEFLNHEHIRATYTAVAGLLGVKPDAMGSLLGRRNKSASWVVSTTTGLPTGYTAEDLHPRLLQKQEVIRLSHDLERRIREWRRIQ
jgi:hypothetical protein